MKSTHHVCVLLLAILLLSLCMRILFLDHYSSSVSPTVLSPGALALFNHTTSTFPWLTFKRELVQEHKLAVVIPFIGVQTWKIIHAWTQTWTKYPPCSTSSSSLPRPFSATLFLYFDQDLDNTTDAYDSAMLMDTLMRAWGNLPFGRCFDGGVKFISNKKGDMNHIEGSCVMFYDLFAHLESAALPWSLPVDGARRVARAAVAGWSA